MKILVTGAAGFIGFHLSKRLINEGYEVIGIDNLNHYYDVRLKLDRLEELGIDTYEIAMGKHELKSKQNSFKFIKMDIKNNGKIEYLFQKESFSVVYNLAAQAGVRYSIEQPKTYVDSNIVGFANILEACRHYKVGHLVYASSSSVYGNQKIVPFKTSVNVSRPISLYAATKTANELMAHTYSHLFNLPTTGLRFFTVYGEWGRPDMAIMLFTKAILQRIPIKVFNYGNLSRDFTYVEDIIDGVIKVSSRHTRVSRNKDQAYRIFNIGNSKPVQLMDFIRVLEKKLGRTAIKEMYPMQPGDVETTYADVSNLENEFGYRPKTTLENGIHNFVNWYELYYQKDLKDSKIKVHN